jgi:acyl-CoA synthetase (AMP-forming)/AMP-acid ligase II
MDTIIERLAPGAEAAPAILAAERPPLTHGALRALIGATVARLNSLGIGPGDRVAIVLPNGPEMATAFLAIAAGATTAPLNPGYREDEFDFYLSDIGAKALVVTADEAGPGGDRRRRRGIPVLRLVADPGGAAGAFTLWADEGSARGPDPPRRATTALLLHTSGTTSRPKLVPLSHANLHASAANIGETGSGSRPTTAASTSCRCSISTA